MSLHDAIRSKDLEAVKLLLEGGASPSAVEHGRTALQLAVDIKDARILDVLLQHQDADVNVLDGFGRSLLHWTTEGSDFRATLFPCCSASWPPAPTPMPKTTLETPLCDHRINRNGATASAVRLLLDEGANPLAVNAKGHTPLRTLLTPTYGPAPPGSQEALLGPAAAALWVAGDRTCWRLIPRGCRGLEQGLAAMMRKYPEDVPLLEARMHPEAQARVRSIREALKGRLVGLPFAFESILEQALMP